MRPGEKFETRCFQHLQNCYRTEETEFCHEGRMDSTKSDIAVMKNGKVSFYVEAKDSWAQSGQFVLYPDDDKGCFVFSPRNKTQPNQMTDIIIAYMNADFPRFRNAGTSGQTLEIDAKVFADWIIAYYESKNVKYVISFDKDYVIFPIRKFQSYFEIKANYRIKKSGSGAVAQRDQESVIQRIQKTYPAATFSKENKRLYVELEEPVTVDRFPMEKYTCYLSEQGGNRYEVRKLSNTKHMNVIFSIVLGKPQDPEDLAEFKAELGRD